MHQYVEPTDFPRDGDIETGAPLIANGDLARFIKGTRDVEIEVAKRRGHPVVFKDVVVGTCSGQETIVECGPSPKFGSLIELHVNGASATVKNEICEWGRVSSDSYASRGWPCSEFSISRFSNCIANPDDPAVAELNKKAWPTSVADYQHMMEKKDPKNDSEFAIRFTSKGDRDVVTFLFYRMCYGLKHAWAADKWVRPVGRYKLPTTEALEGVALRKQVICGPTTLPGYYLAAHVAPQATVAGDVVGALKLQQKRWTLETILLASDQNRWQRRSPICIGDASKRRIRDDFDGRIHCLVWSATGCGWQCTTSEAITLDELRTLFQQASHAPAVVVVCMQFGARLAAEQLVLAGAAAVLWIQSCFMTEDQSGSLLRGVIAPLLETLGQERMARASEETITNHLLDAGEPIFGVGWQAGCLLAPVQAPGEDSLQLLRSWKPAQALDETGWLHDVTGIDIPETLAPVTQTEEETGGGAKHYEALKLIATKDDKACDLLREFDASKLLEWIQACLPTRNDSIVAAMYSDEVRADAKSTRPALQVRIAIDIAFLHELRDTIFDGSLEHKFRNEALVDRDGDEVRVEVTVDQSQFLLMYEKSVLEMDELTKHQKEALAECRKNKDAHLHIEAPAGAGKTFVGLARMLEILRKEPNARALYVARNAGLCYFMVRWICRRESNPLTLRRLVAQLHVLYDEFAQGIRCIELTSTRVEMRELKSTSPAEQYRLVVVDESHHISKDPATRDIVERHISKGSQRLLISDISQSSGQGVAYPDGLVSVRLTEVVRSSRRIVQAALSFQLGEEKLQTESHHQADGPPLKCYLFDVHGGADLFTTYSDEIVKCLKLLQQDRFRATSLADRVAILVPNDTFLDSLRPALIKAKDADSHTHKFEFVDAREASATLMMQGRRSADEAETLVMDTITNVDGLERLIVLAVGLDELIGASDKESDANALETRSKLYRALTRAQMLCIVINEMLPGGWLEHLNTIKLDDANDAKLDREKEMAQLNAKAAGRIVEARKNQVNEAIAEVQKRHAQSTLLNDKLLDGWREEHEASASNYTSEELVQQLEEYVADQKVEAERKKQIENAIASVQKRHAQSDLLDTKLLDGWRKKLEQSEAKTSEEFEQTLNEYVAAQKVKADHRAQVGNAIASMRKRHAKSDLPNEKQFAEWRAKLEALGATTGEELQQRLEEYMAKHTIEAERKAQIESAIASVRERHAQSDSLDAKLLRSWSKKLEQSEAKTSDAMNSLLDNELALLERKAAALQTLIDEDSDLAQGGDLQLSGERKMALRAQMLTEVKDSEAAEPQLLLQRWKKKERDSKAIEQLLLDLRVAHLGYLFEDETVEAKMRISVAQQVDSMQAAKQVFEDCSSAAKSVEKLSTE